MPLIFTQPFRRITLCLSILSLLIVYSSILTAQKASVQGDISIIASNVTTSSPVTQVQASQCDALLATLETDIVADDVALATQYRFRITEGANVQTIDKVTASFKLTDLASYAYNTTYTIDVSVEVDGAWNAYGPACNVTTSSPATLVQASQCGATLATLETDIIADNVALATQYRFRITEGANVQTIDKATASFKLSELASYNYNTTYNIDVAVEANGSWNPYGSSCNVTTASPVTQVQASQCGATLATLETDITADNATLATQYRFRITNGADVQTIDKATASFKLTELGDYTYFYTTTYQVDVAVEVNGSWNAYGSSCDVTTASPVTQVQASQCGATLATLETDITADIIALVTDYRFRITNGANVQTIDKTTPSFKLSELASYDYNTTYTIDVAVKVGGPWNTYGPACDVTTPGGCVWLGTNDELWSNTANWSCGVLPTTITNVTIPASAPNMPVVDITGATCNDLIIGTGASLTISVANALDIKGAISNSGDFTVLGKADFSGTSQTIPAGIYANMEISGSGTKSLAGAVSIDGVLTLSSSFVQLGAHDISIGSAGSITGGSPSSFIIITGTGALKQANIGAGGRLGEILFPVGVSSSSYTPLNVNNTAGISDEFSVRVITGVYYTYDGNDVPTGISETSFDVNRTWLVSEASPGGSNASLRFQWNAAEEQTGFMRTSCFASHYTNGIWLHGPLYQSASGTDPYSLLLTNIASFSPFAVGSAGSTLPVNLLSFSGKPVPGGSLLEWKTDNETSASHFDLQRSTDGSNYILLGNISAANRPGTHEYSFTDPVLFSKTTFYRLKQVDIDGRFVYSAVVVFAAEQKMDGLSVYPNPVVSQANLTIRLSRSGKTNFSLMDNNGNLVRKWQQDLPAGTTAMTINVDGLAAGLYHLELRSPNDSQQRIKLIKQ